MNTPVNKNLIVTSLYYVFPEHHFAHLNFACLFVYVQISHQSLAISFYASVLIFVVVVVVFKRDCFPNEENNKSYIVCVTTILPLP